MSGVPKNNLQKAQSEMCKNTANFWLRSTVRIPADYCSLTDKRKKPECLSNTKTEGSAKQDKIKEYQHELEQEKYNANQKLCEIDQELRFNLNNRRLVIL